MTKVVVISRHGGPDVLEARIVDVGLPGPGQLRIRQTAIGVNFHDIYVRSGQYVNVLSLPGIPGVEACGEVQAVGPDVSNFTPGQRVAYATPRYGAYSEERLLDASLAVHVPARVEDAAAASLMVKGTTAALLLFEVVTLKKGDLVLVHAAAGGVGRFLCQWASHLGAIVVGTVGSPEKVPLARRAGCHHVIDYSREDFVEAVRDISSGRGVRVAYDSVGKDTFAGSLECLARCGHLVNFGQSSGSIAPLTMPQLGAKSASVCRPVVFDYIGERSALDSLTQRVFKAFSEGVISFEGFQKYSLEDAKVAHRDMESRSLMGTPVLVP
jgi:NADPH2:quinone reductase